MKNRKKLFKQTKPLLISVLAFVLLIVATVSYTEYKQGLWEKDIRANLLDVLIGKKSKLEKALYSRIYYTRGVAAFVALKPDITTNEFYELAKEYIKNDTVINSMALSPDCVIDAIYPHEGHEQAIGLDLLQHPERREIVEKTIETHQTFVAGPVELVEGGVAFISYTPIFQRSGKTENRFWGVTDIVIKQDGLFREAQFRTSENGYEYALRGYNGTGENGAVFWGNPDVFDKNPVSIHIELPIGTWVLAATPSSGWKEYPDQDKAFSLILIISSFIISVLVWLFTSALFKISQNEKDLKAIFGSMDNLIVEYSSKGEYLKIAPTNDSILIRPKHELIGKTVHEVLDRDLADHILKSIQECLSKNELVVIEYRLTIQAKEHWFSARINPKSDQVVIFNAFEVTELKRNEMLVRESGKRLQHLNEMKDKFYSIIAHDLRNPVGSMNQMFDLIVADFETLPKDELKMILTNLKESSRNLYHLLEDLLEWSRSQTGKLNVKKQAVDVNKLINNQFANLQFEAKQKEIELFNEVDPGHFFSGDADLTGIVLRNLITNAIKFTERGGSVRISAEVVLRNNESLLKIKVQDSGIGMDINRLNSLFVIDQSESTPGTENEKGTGLGLLLCKELVEKQGGTLEVNSEPGLGSTFAMVMPVAENVE